MRTFIIVIMLVDAALLASMAWNVWLIRRDRALETSARVAATQQRQAERERMDKLRADVDAIVRRARQADT